LPAAIPYSKEEFRTNNINGGDESKNYNSSNTQGKLHSRACHEGPE
jgi:hypothetical protein